jgi:hypothetical protein
MKIVLFAIFLLAPVLALADKPNPADYTIAVHVQSSRLVNMCMSDAKGSTCGWAPRLTVLIDGKKVELQDQNFRLDVILPGDYKAKIVKENTSHSYEYSRTYEFLFPDGTTRKYIVVGESE